MKTIILSLLIFLSTATIIAQDSNIKYQLQGSALDMGKNPVEFASVSLWSVIKADSLQFVSGSLTDDVGHFVFSDIQSGDYILKITYIGYSEYNKNININSTKTLEPIYLDESNRLAEVVVKANRPVIKANNGILTLDVANTSLNSLSTISDVLAFAPGVQLIGNEISVLGREGNPLIFINDKEVKNKSEINLLQPSDISSISVDRNPSAKYGAEYRSVIHIYTRSKNSDSWSAQVNHTSFINNRYNQSEGVNVDANYGKFESSLMYKYTNEGYKTRSKSYQDVDYNNLKQLSNSDGTMRDVINTHDLTVGTTYNINKLNKLDLQYHGEFDKQNASIWNIESVQNLKLIQKDIYRHGKGSGDNHDVSLNYTVSDSLNKLNVYVDYIHQVSDVDQNIDTKTIGDDEISYDRLINNSKFDIVVGKIEYNRLLPQDYNLSVGLKYSGTINKTKSLLQNIDTEEYNIDDRSHLDDKIYAGYTTLSRQFGKLYAEAGLRLEYNKSNYKLNGKNVFDKDRADLFPSLSFQYEVNSNINLSLNLAEKITRLPFSDLDPTLNYITSITYSQGDPSLKPQREYYAELEAMINNKWTISTSYKYYRNFAGKSYVLDDDYPEILIFRPINIHNASTINVSAGYTNSWGWYTLKANGLFSYTDNEIPTIEGNVKINKPKVQTSVSNIFKLGSNLNIMLNFAYRNRFHYITYDIEPTYMSNVAVNFKLLKNKLDLTVFGNDLLNKSQPRVTAEYGYVKYGQEAKKDLRQVGVTLKYNFNGFRNKSKVDKQNAEELSRIGL